MHPLPAALALGAALVLPGPLPAHAGDTAADDAASRPPSFAAALVQRSEAPGFVLPRIHEEALVLENERYSSPAPGTGSSEASRARPKAKLAVGRPKGASITAGSRSPQAGAGWVGVTLQF